MCSLLVGTPLGVAGAMTDLLGESQLQGIHCGEHAMGHVEGSGGCLSNLMNQGLRELCNWADTARQVAMLKRRAQIRDSINDIQEQRDATSGQMAMHSRCHRAEQFPKLAAAVCGCKQVVSEPCHRNINMLVIRVATNAEMLGTVTAAISAPESWVATI